MRSKTRTHEGSLRMLKTAFPLASKSLSIVEGKYWTVYKVRVRPPVFSLTKLGDKIFKSAIKKGLIESKSLKDVKPGQPLLERIAGTKRKNCKSIELKTNNNKNNNI